MKPILSEIHQCLHRVWVYLDSGVIVASMATFFGWLPDITAFFGLIYLLLRIWETETVREKTNRVSTKEK